MSSEPEFPRVSELLAVLNAEDEGLRAALDKVRLVARPYLEERCRILITRLEKYVLREEEANES